MQFNKRSFFQLSFLLLVLSLLLSACDSSAERKEITQQAWQMIDDGALVIDVRTPKEYSEGHLEGAPLIPFDNMDELVKLIGNNKSQAVVLYCRSGHRAGVAQEALAELGYTNIFNGLGYNNLRSARR